MNLHGITTAKIIPLDLARLDEAAGRQDEVDAELRPFFEEEAKDKMQAIEAVLQNWDQGTGEDPLKQLRLHFHAIKGAANSIGHLRIGALASGMEDLFKTFHSAYASSLRGQIIKTSIVVLQTMRALIEEARQPQFYSVKKEQVVKAAESISSLRQRGTELKGAA